VNQLWPMPRILLYWDVENVWHDYEDVNNDDNDDDENDNMIDNVNKKGDVMTMLLTAMATMRL
jgi:hypothetical protein